MKPTLILCAAVMLCGTASAAIISGTTGADGGEQPLPFLVSYIQGGTSAEHHELTPAFFAGVYSTDYNLDDVANTFEFTDIDFKVPLTTTTVGDVTMATTGQQVRAVITDIETTPVNFTASTIDSIINDTANPFVSLIFPDILVKGYFDFPGLNVGSLFAVNYHAISVTSAEVGDVSTSPDTQELNVVYDVLSADNQTNIVLDETYSGERYVISVPARVPVNYFGGDPVLQAPEPPAQIMAVVAGLCWLALGSWRRSVAAG